MYNVELLSKTKHKESTYNDSLSLFKDIKVITLGLNEIKKLSCILPVVISGGEEQRFVVVTGLRENYFLSNRCKDIYIPASIKTYPFVMVNAKSNDKDVRAIAIDKDALNGENKIYDENGNFTQKTNSKIELLKKFDLDVLKSKSLINDLKNWGLLEKSNIELKTDKETKRILSDFFVVNRKKLYSLEENKFNKLARSGVLSILESHIDSISNIKNLIF